MNDWNIQSRAHHCEACGKAFTDQHPYHTLLFDQKHAYHRQDICDRCWQERFAPEAGRSDGFVSYWHGLYEAPPLAAPDPIQKDTAETLLRKLTELNDPKYAAAGYILAVMLERKRLLKVKEQIVRDGQRIFIYEQPRSGDVFTIPDPNLQLNQLEQVQHDVAALLEHGLPEIAPAPRCPSCTPGPAGKDLQKRPAMTRLPWKWPRILQRRFVNSIFNVVNLDALQDRLGYTFQDRELLRLALTHPSVAHESTGNLPHNQRLEFLGDSILGLVLTRELYDKFPAFGEGPLTKARAQMVNRRTLASEARRLNLGSYLILSRGEELSGGRDRQSCLADALEAVLGAMFIDGGFEAARTFILRCFQDVFGELTRIPSLDNPKGELQEVLQANSSAAPLYELTSVTGPDHDRDFECAVFHNGCELGRGRGKSKKAAESAAAVAALVSLRDRSGPCPNVSPMLCQRGRNDMQP